MVGIMYPVRPITFICYRLLERAISSNLRLSQLRADSKVIGTSYESQELMAKAIVYLNPNPGTCRWSSATDGEGAAAMQAREIAEAGIGNT